MKDEKYDQTKKRMDRFDRLVRDYLRTYRKSVDILAKKINCSPASLWRYRNHVESFERAPFDVICSCLRLFNASNEDLRYILGLPTGKCNEN